MAAGMLRCHIRLAFNKTCKEENRRTVCEDRINNDNVKIFRSLSGSKQETLSYTGSVVLEIERDMFKLDFLSCLSTM